MTPILIKEKLLVTPKGLPMEVPTETLADAIIQEWERDKSIQTNGFQDKIFTSLAATALDRIPETGGEIVQHLASICENDQLLCWSDQGEDLIKAQEDHWRPLINFVNSHLELTLQSRYDLHIRTLDPDEVKTVKAWCQNLGSFQLSAFAYMVELSHSFIVPFCLVEGMLQDSYKAWEIAELHEIQQRSHWGEDKEDMEKSRKRCQEFESSYLFFRAASIETGK